MIRASSPGKLVVAGAFVVLQGGPGVGLAVSPRLRLSLRGGPAGTWPVLDPFADAVRHVLGLAPSEVQSLAVRAGFPVPVQGWSLGSSAAYVTALSAALSRHAGRPLLGADLFAVADAAHRRAQGGVGSGLDVACCAFGGSVMLVRAQGAGNPAVAGLPWPRQVGVCVVPSPVDSGTADRVRRFLSDSHRPGAEAWRPLATALQGLVHALSEGGDALASLAEVAVREAGWREAVAPGFEPAVLPAVSAALRPLLAGGSLVVKSLGAGDAVGVFADRARIAEGDVLLHLEAAGLPARVVAPDAEGTRIDGIDPDPEDA